MVFGTHTITADANLGIVRRLLEEGWNRGKLDVVDELAAHDAVPAHESPSPGRQFWKDAMQEPGGPVDTGGGAPASIGT